MPDGALMSWHSTGLTESAQSVGPKARNLPYQETEMVVGKKLVFETNY